ncbi:hypothetical protein BBD42_15475 [Paenibacillus sp. BIHB 4019]|uniref:Uncharacterized protein n=1 Tax=Paenibacillus sp. BIHB 4019 TaxID=1870819 RepID=A0A1B2DJ39_9BACL|nr:hypothetical protein [Paenibacillus sp. BIHB 4019]ANY67709.1 hypothetical protein BBD42_15475 [Paenibacillus sp. BIHB 4019]
MKHVLIVEVTTKDVFDAEMEEIYAVLTPEQRAERIGVMKAEVVQLFADELDSEEITVTVRVEEIPEEVTPNER